jgi:transketolase
MSDLAEHVVRHGRREGAESSDGEVDRLAVATIRTLVIDAVQKARSGHAGLPMGMAPAAYTLWTRFLRYDPSDPGWPDRDRFVLSAGHGSMLLYALLHLAGVQDGRSPARPAVSLEDLKAFRQLDSRCPGHPEYGHTVGVETTTGPLGQGAANSVGMAIAERWLEHRFNAAGAQLFDHRVYALCSDGDMMEGISSEAASIAGHLKLSNLCWIYDDNAVTIEGAADLAFSEDVARRFQGYGWATLTVEDANDCEAFASAVEAFLETRDRPTLIRVRSVIGFGSPHKQGTAKIHSDPLGEEEVRLTKRAYGWPEDAQFRVPEAVLERFQSSIGARGRRLRGEWEAALRAADPARAEELRRLRAGELPADWDADVPWFPADAKGVATREASGRVLNAIASRVPWLLGGSADLAPSTKTRLEFLGAGDLAAGGYGGRNLHFGVREHAMGAIANGLALSGLRPYAGTFLVFSDYMRPSTRLAALMGLPVVFVFSHDSISLGEDGPTHQPIEQLCALRAIPGLTTLRPCDANETAEAWRIALARAGPACLVLSRQSLPTLDRSRYAPAGGVARGAYVLADSRKAGAPEVILMATGSEVPLCVEAYEELAAEGVGARVVSMPSWDLFEAQDEDYRRSVLPPEVTARVAVEAAAGLGWDRYAGAGGEVIAMRGFGASAPIQALQRRFGFTAEHVLAAARRQLAGAGITPRRAQP